MVIYRWFGSLLVTAILILVVSVTRRMSRKKQAGVGALLVLVAGIVASIVYPPLGELVFEIGAVLNLGIPEGTTYLPDIAELRSRGGLIKQAATFLFAAVATASVAVVGEQAWNRYGG